MQVHWQIVADVAWVGVWLFLSNAVNISYVLLPFPGFFLFYYINVFFLLIL